MTVLKAIQILSFVDSDNVEEKLWGKKDHQEYLYLEKIFWERKQFKQTDSSLSKPVSTMQFKDDKQNESAYLLHSR